MVFLAPGGTVLVGFFFVTLCNFGHVLEVVY